MKSSSLPPWLDKEVLDSMRLRDHLKSTKKWDDYKKLRNATTNLIKRKKKEHINHIIEKTDNKDTRPIWDLINNRCEDNRPRSMFDGSSETTNSYQIAKVLNDHFSTIVEKLDANNRYNPGPTQTLPSFTDSALQHHLSDLAHITPHSITKLLYDIPLTKAAGHDHLNPCFFFVHASLIYFPQFAIL